MTRPNILIPTAGPRTVFDEFKAPITVTNKKVTLRGGPYYGSGVTFDNVFGSFRGAAITISPQGSILKIELVPVEKQGSIYR